MKKVFLSLCLALGVLLCSCSSGGGGGYVTFTSSADSASVEDVCDALADIANVNYLDSSINYFILEIPGTAPTSLFDLSEAAIGSMDGGDIIELSFTDGVSSITSQLISVPAGWSVEIKGDSIILQKDGGSYSQLIYKVTTTATDSSGVEESVIAVFTYDDSNRVIGVNRTYKNGDEEESEVVTITYSFDEVVVSVDGVYWDDEYVYKLDPATNYAISSNFNSGSTYTYTSAGYLDTYTESDGRTREFIYDSDNNCTNIDCTLNTFTEEFTYYENYDNSANLDINSIVGMGDSHFTLYGYDTILGLLGAKSPNLVKSWNQSGDSGSFSYVFNKYGLPYKVNIDAGWSDSDESYTVEMLIEYR